MPTRSESPTRGHVVISGPSSAHGLGASQVSTAGFAARHRDSAVSWLVAVRHGSGMDGDMQQSPEESNAS